MNRHLISLALLAAPFIGACSTEPGGSEHGGEHGEESGTELGPGESRVVTLVAESTGFDGWSAHPEVGSDEHGGGEGHSEEGAGEHR